MSLNFKIISIQLIYRKKLSFETSFETLKDEKTCELDSEQLQMDHICIDGKEEEITSSVSTSCFGGVAVSSVVTP